MVGPDPWSTWVRANRGVIDDRQAFHPLAFHHAGRHRQRGRLGDDHGRFGHEVGRGVRVGLGPLGAAAATFEELPVGLQAGEFQFGQEIGLGHHADHAAVGVHHRQRADRPVGQRLHELPVRRVRVGRGDVGGHDVAYRPATGTRPLVSGQIPVDEAVHEMRTLRAPVRAGSAKTS
jgi:hypothetical protein